MTNNFSYVEQVSDIDTFNKSALCKSIQEENIIKLCCTKFLHFFCKKKRKKLSQYDIS